MDTNPAAPSGGRYEKRDANIRSLVWFGMGLFLTLVLVVVAMARLFRYFAASQSLGPPASPFSDVRVLPPPPRLEVEPHRDLERWRADQEALLAGYGWVDRKAGMVRIPINRAMDLLVDRGLPVRTRVPAKEINR